MFGSPPAVAIMKESTPVITRIRRASSKPISTQLLFSITAMWCPRPLTKSTTTVRRSISARWRRRMLHVWQRIVRQLMPVLTTRSTRASVSCCAGAGSRQIFAETELRGELATREYEPESSQSQLERGNSSLVWTCERPLHVRFCSKESLRLLESP